MNEMMILDKPIRQMSGLYCLNDLHKASQTTQTKKPSEWLRLVQVSELVYELKKTVGKAGFPTLEQNQEVIKTIKGGNKAGTYACRELVLAYATWISPPFFLEVLRTFDRKERSGSLKTSAIVSPDLPVPRSLAEVKALQMQLLQEQCLLTQQQRLFNIKQTRAEPWFRYWHDVEAENVGLSVLPLR